jgi:hypothetical protein
MSDVTYVCLPPLSNKGNKHSQTLKATFALQDYIQFSQGLRNGDIVSLY